VPQKAPVSNEIAKRDRLPQEWLKPAVEHG
jgi:hypothetical protein